MMGGMMWGLGLAAVCRTFGVRRSTLIDSLSGIGWFVPSKGQGA
jgi:hypothetical protein